MRTTRFRRHPWLVATPLVAGVATLSLLAALAGAVRLAGADTDRSGEVAVNVAQANLAAARASAQRAETFRAVARNERSDAHRREATARYDEERALAADRLGAADAKTQVAENLVMLRRQEVELRQAELDLARAKANLAQVERLANRPGTVDRNDFVRAQTDAEAAVKQKRAAVDATRAALDTAVRGWNEVHHRFDVAARRAGSISPEAPLPPID